MTSTKDEPSSTSSLLFTPHSKQFPPTLLQPLQNNLIETRRTVSLDTGTKSNDITAIHPISSSNDGNNNSTLFLDITNINQQTNPPPPPSSIRRSKTELVLNRTSSFSRIVFELNDDLNTDKKLSNKPENGNGNKTTSPETTTSTSSKSSPFKQSTLFLTRLGILLSRSSGRDKFAQFLQYGALFWGNQTLLPTSQARDAPWRNLEESMSSGRKLLRLFKWIKEFERAQRSFWLGDELSVMANASSIRSFIARVLGTFMHSFSFLYYLFDNILYCSQVGLINRPMFLDRAALRLQLRAHYPTPDFSQLSKLQNQHQLDQEMRIVVQHRESQLKDWRNYSSLFRLLLCCVYCTLQLDTISQERVRIETEIEQIKSTAALNNSNITDTGYDTEGSNFGNGNTNNTGVFNVTNTNNATFLITSNILTIKELKLKLQRLADAKKDNMDEIYSTICNLIILLNRLEFSIFKNTPTWFVGICGMIAAMIGLEKNWPKIKESKSSSGKKKTNEDNSGGNGE
jgi:hypothetical protein